MTRRYVELVAVLGLSLIVLVVSYFLSPTLAAAEVGLREVESTVAFQRASLSLLVAIGLLAVAFPLFIMQRKSGPTTLWHAFWLSSFIAMATSYYFNYTASASDVLAAALLVAWLVDIILGFLPQGSETATRPPVDLQDRLPWVDHVRPPQTAVRLFRGILHLIVFVAVNIAALRRGDFRIEMAVFFLYVAVILAVVTRIVRRPFYHDTLAGRMLIGGFGAINKIWQWYDLPTWLAVINLAALRETMRLRNLHGTSKVPVTNEAGLIDGGRPPASTPEDLVLRRDDGCYNDLNSPNMGRGSSTSDPSGDAMLHDKSSPGARLGRNVPLEVTFPDLGRMMSPSPRLISEKILARREFIPASTLNLIAAAWIQFQVHDWFNHGEPVEQDPLDVPITDDDPWRKEFGSMKVRRTRPDPTRDYAAEAEAVRSGKARPFPPTYVNSETHWWDGSQIYGSNAEATRRLRTSKNGEIAPSGHLVVDEHGNIPVDPADPNGIAISGFVGNWWVGLSLLHNIFVKEHNAICDMLRQSYGTWTSDRIFETARMINAALMAKIHTVEWTPAILQHPALQIGMAANWWGLATKAVTQTFGRLGPTEAFSGIPNSGVDHQGADYSLTEEFNSVYRLHPLMPDEFQVLSLQDGKELCRETLPGRVVGPEGRLLTGQFEKPDLWYSFGMANPGAITVRNYPAFLRKLTRDSALETMPESGRRRVIGETIDLAAVDILRDRERGVPRYNEFRRQFALKPITSFDDLAHPRHPGLPQDLRDVYGTTGTQDNVEDLDLMVGMFSEKEPEGFGFSDTAFRVFILMASRRLKSDRFIAQGFNDEVFTAEGVKWVNDNSMLSLLKRHFPSLSGALYGLANAFVPWHSPEPQEFLNELSKRKSSAVTHG